MRITEYRRTSQGWQQAREYYWFMGDRDHEPWSRDARAACPGCGRVSTPMAQTAHECLGGMAPYPRISNPRPNHKGRGGRPRRVK
jgi:hypothetical protein